MKEYSGYESIEIDGNLQVNLISDTKEPINEKDVRELVYNAIKDDAFPNLDYDGKPCFDDDDEFDYGKAAQRFLNKGTPVSINVYNDGGINLTDYESDIAEDGAFDYFCDYMEKDMVQHDFGAEIVAAVRTKLKEKYPEAKFEIEWSFKTLKVESEEKILDNLHERLAELDEIARERAAELRDCVDDADLEDHGL